MFQKNNNAEYLSTFSEQIDNLKEQDANAITGTVSAAPDDELSEIKEILSNLTKNSQTLKGDMENLKKHHSTLQKQIKESEKQVKTIKRQFTEVFGLFGTFITFILANVTVFSKVKSISIAIAFMGAMLLCMLVFLYGFILFLEKEDKPLQSKIQKLIWRVLVGVGVMYLVMFLMEKSISSVLVSYHKGKPICVNCRIDQGCNIQETYPILQNK